MRISDHYSPRKFPHYTTIYLHLHTIQRFPRDLRTVSNNRPCPTCCTSGGASLVISQQGFLHMNHFRQSSPSVTPSSRAIHILITPLKPYKNSTYLGQVHIRDNDTVQRTRRVPRWICGISARMVFVHEVALRFRRSGLFPGLAARNSCYPYLGSSRGRVGA
jgi:hypothetical protein